MTTEVPKMTDDSSAASATSLATVLAVIVSVAPETEDEVGMLDHAADIFEVLGLDSMDHLAVMTEIAERTGIEIPEREYGRLRSIASLAARIAL